MDKKKFQQPYSGCSSKGSSATDAKKSQDVNNSKQFPKSSRRREPPRANNFSKNDQPRKSNAQKTKVFDKRPKPKGQYHGGPKEDSKVVVNDEAEHGSVMVRGSKKQNLNHLLNFHFTPRNAQSGWSYGSGYNSHNYNRWLPPIQRHKYNKEQFLQANCQFVVTANGDYSLYLNDPDILVDWKLIEQIIVKSSDNLSCPICLYPPIAGKMTRCGHVYCWPCILHYLSFSEKSWHKCPICYESVHKSDLKSVKIQTNENTLNIGDDITLRLMRRQKGSLIPQSVGDNESPPLNEFLHVSDKSCHQIYSKLLLAQNKDIMDIIIFERDELMCGLLEDSESPTVPFIQQALNELVDREKLLNEISNNESNQSMKGKNNVFENEENITSDKIKSECEEKENELKEDFNNSACSKDYFQNDTKVVSGNTETSLETLKFHYFYQADNGQNVYLHAMNVKMLEMQFGSLEKSPLTISGKLLEKEVGSFTEDLRRRMRYLCHLPLTSQFEIVEIDLQSIVSDEVLKSFQGQLNDRQRNRKKRERDEKKREKKITEEENKQMGKYPTPKVHIESRKHFPQFQSESEEFPVSSSESIVSSIASSPSTATLEEIINGAGGELRNSWSSSGNQGPSFAQMLQNTGSRSSVAWPTLSTPRKAEPKVSSSDEHQLHDFDPEMEEYMVPLTSPSLSDAVARALENKELMENSGLAKASGKKKKKKQKATVLFATNMARSS